MATNASNGLEAHDSEQSIDERDVRALEQYLTVLPDYGRAKGATGLFMVVSESGEEYLVDTYQPACECADFEYRSPAGGCKHIRRVAFATGERSIPANVDRTAIDDQLGQHVDGEVRIAATDGGVATIDDFDDQDDVDGAEECEDCQSMTDLPCFEHFEVGE